MFSKKHLALILTLLLSLSILSGCTESNSKKTVKQFLDAYQKSDQPAMDALMRDPGTLGNPYVIDGLPENVIAKYKTLFVDFKYSIEREEILKNKANVYVKMTYKDAGNPSITAFNDYQTKSAELSFSGGSADQIMAILEESFMTALSTELAPVEETIVIPLEQNAEGQWKIVASGEFQNALTSNMGLMVAAVDELIEEMSTTTGE